MDVLLVGAGSRGRDTFGRYALRHPERMRIVGVAEPDAERRNAFQALNFLCSCGMDVAPQPPDLRIAPAREADVISRYVSQVLPLAFP